MRTDTNPENVSSVDFSDSVPNPYIGKVRRRVPAAQEDAEGNRGRERERSLMEFRLASGTVITNEDIERECAEYESGSWAGTLTLTRQQHETPEVSHRTCPHVARQ